jgi:hypothetical protein
MLGPNRCSRPWTSARSCESWAWLEELGDPLGREGHHRRRATDPFNLVFLEPGSHQAAETGTYVRLGHGDQTSVTL